LARSLPPITWFRAFESAARHLNFTAAAQELGLTQSAISQQVSALESRSGYRLFVRKSRGLALTDEGRRLLPTVAQGIATLRLAAESFDTQTDKDVLTIATSVSISQWYLVPEIQEFAKAHEDVAIRLMTKVWPDEFDDKAVDVEIRFDSSKSHHQEAQALGSAEQVLIGSPKLLHTNPSVTTLPELVANHPLIQVVGTSDTWQAWAKATDYEGILNPSVFVDSHGMAVDFAKSGTGIALTSRVVAAPCLRDGSLLLLGTSPEPAKDRYSIQVLNTQKRETAEKFAAWLQDKVRGRNRMWRKKRAL